MCCGVAVVGVGDMSVTSWQLGGSTEAAVELWLQKAAEALVKPGLVLHGGAMQEVLR